MASDKIYYTSLYLRLNIKYIIVYYLIDEFIITVNICKTNNYAMDRGNFFLSVQIFNQLDRARGKKRNK